MKKPDIIPLITKILISLGSILLFIFLRGPALAKITTPGLDNKLLKQKNAHPSPSRLDQAREHFKKGVQYSQAQRVDLAIQEYRKTLEFDPNFVMAHVNLGMSYLQQQEVEAAIQELKKAIQKDPKLKLARFDLWWAYRQQGKYDEGIAELKAVIALDPNNVNAYLNLGDSYLADKKMLPEAIQAYLEALARGRQTALIHQKIGKAYELSGQVDKAIEQFQRAISVDKNNLYTYLFLYVCLEKSKKKLEAAEALRNGLSAFRKEPRLADSSYQDIAHIMECLLGTYPEKDLMSIKNPIITCQLHYYLGMYYLFQNKRKEAAQHLQQAIDTKINTISEYEYAKIELERIKGQK